MARSISLVPDYVVRLAAPDGRVGGGVEQGHGFGYGVDEGELRIEGEHAAGHLGAGDRCGLGEQEAGVEVDEIAADEALHLAAEQIVAVAGDGHVDVRVEQLGGIADHDGIGDRDFPLEMPPPLKLA